MTATDADAQDSIHNYVKDATNSDGPKFELVKENGVKTGGLVFRSAPDFDNPTGTRTTTTGSPSRRSAEPEAAN